MISRSHSRVRSLRVFLWTLAALLAACGGQASTPRSGASQVVAASPAPADNVVARARDALARGVFRYRVTIPEEAIVALGEPGRQGIDRDGESWEMTTFEYPGVTVVFRRLAPEGAPTAPGPRPPPTLVWVEIDSEPQAIGRDGVVVLANLDELHRFDPDEGWTGLSAVSLARLDLREELPRLEIATFDTRTVWPSVERLPAGFDPTAVLAAGKSPGLGVRALHARGLDGRGVTIAYIDQPLLRDHVEYRDAIVDYQPIEVDDAKPQMHGPRVASIAVGRTLGVAPGARLVYYAVPSWNWAYDAGKYASVLDRIIERNASASPADRIRIVGISYGGFRQGSGVEAWEAAKIRLRDSGVLLVTCDEADFNFNIARRVPGRDPEDPASYVHSAWGGGEGELQVPGGGRTLASETGADVYAYDPEGGNSWGAPWVVGLATIGLQANPSATPELLKRLLLETATPTSIGPVASPERFVAALSAGPARRRAASR